MSDANSTHNVLCFGEVLWDRLPDGEVPGGAPMNVAYHLTRMGCTAWLMSSVGNDALGAELLRRLQNWGVRCDHVTIDANYPTGVVDVAVDNGSPSYDIAEDVAWDRITVPDDLGTITTNHDAIVFGSLAARREPNRSNLLRVLEQMSLALKVFDVNLRPPYDDADLVRRLAREADLVKLNDEEVAGFLGADVAISNLEDGARKIANMAGCDRVCVTAGADGAGLLDDGTWYWSKGEKIVVSDTVGAGDAFLAALVAGLLRSPKDPEPILANASRLGGFVASRKGATPDYTLPD